MVANKKNLKLNKKIRTHIVVQSQPTPTSTPQSYLLENFHYNHNDYSPAIFRALAKPFTLDFPL